MDEVELIKSWYQYNFEVRAKYFALLSILPKGELGKDRGASFPTLTDIYSHVLDAYRWWFVYVLEDRVAEYKRIDSSAGLEAVRKEEESINSVVSSVLASITPSSLDRTLVFDIPGEGRATITMRDLLWHLVEEELQHRGEMNALLWQMDIDPPITGWDDWQQEKREHARKPGQA